MRFWLSLHSYPLRFLLYLEWLLLAIVAFVEIPTRAFLAVARSPLINWVGLSLFTAMGFKLPKTPLARWVFLVMELSLIWIMTHRGGLRLFHLLYLVTVIRNCVLFQGWQSACITSGIILLCAVNQLQRLQQRPLLAGAIADQIGLIWLSFILLFSLVVLFLQLLVKAVLAERHSRNQLAEANTQLRQYALKVQDLATAQERNRIAREIHDSLGHSLTVFNLHLEAALRLLNSDPNEAKALLQEAKQVGASTLQQVRQSVATLRANPLEGKGLEPAIAELVSDFQRATGITPHCTIHLQRELSVSLAIAIYRIIQESLTNICKYAEASDVRLSLLEQANQIQLIVEDNGKGFDPKQTTTGFGLQGIQERTLSCQGRFEIKTAPGAGCRFVATFPL